MGFGLNVASSIMQTIVDALLMKDKRIQRATSAYIDDVYVDESIVPAAGVKEHLCSFSLLSKEPERLCCILTQPNMPFKRREVAYSIGVGELG